MLKRFSCFSCFFAYLLMVLIPLHGIAAANLSICNSLMQPDAQQAMHNMPCHDGMNSSAQQHEEHSKKDTCKTICASLCASLSAMTTLTSMAPATAFFGSMQAVNFPQQVYISITQPSLQRPPITFI